MDGGDLTQNYAVVFKGSAIGGGASSGAIGEVSLFQFSDGSLYKSDKLHPGGDGRADISVVGDSRLYFLTGVEIPGAAAPSEEDFCGTLFGAGLHDNSAPDFLTAVVGMKIGDLGAGSRTDIPVVLQHGVARLDLNTTADSKTKITEIVVEDAPLETCPFDENRRASDKTVRYEKTLPDDFNGFEEEIFRIFESPKPVHVALRGTYDGVPIRLQIEIPAIERNKIYTVAVLNAGATVEGIFEIKPWEEGGTVTGKPDIDKRILLDAAASDIPEGVTADYEHNVVEVPAEGVAKMTLAFSYDTRIDLSQVEGAGPGTHVGDVSVTEGPGGVVSSVDVAVDPQGKGRLGYTVLLHLKNALLSGPYDYVEIRVAPSPYQIETVEMGGSVWMAFNARSRELEDQIYPLDGITVEEMYRTGWINTVGGLFQFGRQYMYVPWLGYNPSNNLGNQKQDIPWQNDTHMPCPEGYRVPTVAELQSLLPSGTTLPGTYTAGNGESITATLHEAEGTLTTPSGVTGRQRYVKFTSGDTGNTLIIPLAGGKGDKSTTNNPSFGMRAVLWASENTGCSGGYAMAFWLPFENAETTTAKRQQLQMEAFASLRCVRK